MNCMNASMQNLIQEFKTVVFKNTELEFRYTSELNAFLPILACEDSHSDVEIVF